ncbi:MAG: glycosyltransferase family 39 protein [Planctomycetota bacterium]
MDDRGTNTPKNSRGLPTALAVLACLVGGAIRAYWAFLLPYNHAPDEFCHYAMVRYLSKENRPPTMADVPARVPVSYPAVPFVGYLPSAIAHRLWITSLEDHVGARLGNVAVGMATIWVTYAAARRFTPRSPATTLSITWVAALHPQLVFIDSYSNNDASMILACGFLWYFWVRIAEVGQSGWTLTALGIAGGIALLTKTNSLSVLLAGAPIVLEGFWRGASWKRILVGYSWAALLTGAVCLPWILWSWNHHRSLWGISVHRQWWFDHLSRNRLEQGFLDLDKFPEFLSMTWQSFWGAFGYQNVLLADVDYFLATAATGIAVGALISRGRTLPARAGWTNEPAWWALAGSLTLGIALSWVLHVSHSAQFGLSPQGRYLMPAFFPFASLLCFGWSVLFQSPKGEWVGGILITLLVAWLQVEAVDAERSSHRVRQSTREARSRLTTYAAPFPDANGEIPWKLEPAEATRLTLAQGLLTLQSEKTHFACRTPLLPADRLGWVQFDEMDRGTETETGSVAIEAGIAPARELGRIPFHRSSRGALTYQLDLRQLAQKVAGENVRVVLRWQLSANSLQIRRLEILDRSHQPLSPEVIRVPTGD